MLHLFIDTNVYLRFFGFSTDELEELRKTKTAIASRDLKLWVTEQTRDEIRRNREGEVARSIKALADLKASSGAPLIARQLPEFDDFQKARREFEGQVDLLVDQLTEQVTEHKLAADHVLDELLEGAGLVAVSDEILNAARRRVDLGHPPGKKGSLGDAVHWECLLAQVPDGQDLYLVTADSDFVSKLDQNRIAEFLADEWKKKKSARVRLYPRLSGFFQEEYPDIKLATELEQEARVRALVDSGGFAQTHRAISELSPYSDLTERQVRDLFRAALVNSQINWIAHDPDVNQFFRQMVDAHKNLFDAQDLEVFEQHFGAEEVGEGEGDHRQDDFPF